MLTKAVEGVTRQFNAQVDASIAMLVNLGIPLEHIELINHTTADLGVVTEVRARTSDEAQAAAIEREAIAAWVNLHRDLPDKWWDDERVAGLCGDEACLWWELSHNLAQAIRNGEHVKP